MDKRYGILIVSVTIFVLCFVGTASATNWSVDGSGGADFTGIQDAINNASDGDMIIVHSGVYYENVVVDKSVTLRGIGQPVVDARWRGKSVVTLSADGITVERFNVTKGSWEGAGITISSSNNTITGNTVCHSNKGGIALYSSSNNTITDNNISNNGGGIDLWHPSNNNTITGNNVSNNNDDGISLYDSSNNIITGNPFVNGGLYVYSSYQNTVEDNTVNGKPLVYLKDVSDYKVEDAGQVILVNCSNITVENLDLYNTRVGIDLLETKNSKISNNKVCNNSGDGIDLRHSSNNTITGNNVSNNDEGIHLSSSSSNNTITGNNVCNNSGDGIDLWYSNNNNTITGNNVCSNYEGIYLFYSSNNTIKGNNVSNNNYDGISLYYSSNNKIYFNNFINNTDNVDSYKSTNIWNSPLEITYTYDGTTYKSYLGNYWDDYEGTDADGDGIGDTHYSIYSESDDYPLMKPFENYILPRSASI